VALVAKEAPGFSKKDAIYTMEGLAEKVHELKHKCVPAVTTLRAPDIVTGIASAKLA